MTARLALAASLAVLAALVADRLAPLDLSRLESTTRMVNDRNGVLLRAFTTDDDMWRYAAQRDEVDPLYVAMLMAWEDKRFEDHVGVDPLAVLRALGQWVEAGRIISGASTLTMQTARLLEPRSRDLGSKIIEMTRALQLERRYTKNEILAAYLTLSPFGGNLEGVRAASLAYFGKEPSRLTPAEAALLVALPQSPEALRPDRHPEAAMQARNRVLDRAAEAGLISIAEAQAAKQAAIPAGRYAMPFLAPHLAERLARAETADTITTTLDAGLQAGVERLFSLASPVADPGASAAVMIVDNRTGEVLVDVGALDYFNERRDGMVDMTRAIRSPGSALKPFIYGEAFARRLIHPAMLIDDRPRDIGGYRPTNFDDGFHGVVTMRQALAASLNVPAVAVLDRLGAQTFDTVWREAGLQLHYPTGDARPGLPLALGGVGVSLETMVTAYAALASGGEVPRLHYLSEVSSEEAGRLMPEFAAWYVADTLREAPRANGFTQYGRHGDIAFKTGTSYGYRDAWALGFTANYTVGVWLGRPDGGSCNGCVGIEAAAPVMLAVFDLLPDSGGRALPIPPDDALVVRTAALPTYLQRFDRTPESEGPQLAFPIDGTVLRLAQRDAVTDVLPLRADGGEQPYLWLVNGAPVETNRSGEAVWVPDGAGFVSVSVTDAAGRSASADVFVELVARN
ncbi:MAG: penicillin-binding protein 1C [Alphaproteobacteria bacterium]|nr:penicillin-binding protein 1C [Alphaproteobacteria bacterium]